MIYVTDTNSFKVIHLKMVLRDTLTQQRRIDNGK